MPAYYNELDAFAAQWLRNLIAAGHIAAGEVDERSIVEVQPDDLRVFTQCHFFAGIGGWSHALRLAGFDDARPVWSGSCPCQPFSAPGSQGFQRSGDVELQGGSGAHGSTATAGFWRDAEWIACRDGKARPTEPGVEPLVDGIPARVGRLRGYGNAIVAPQAAEFVRAFLEVRP